MKTLFIPEKYYKIYQTEPLYSDKKKAALIQKRITNKEIIVVPDEQWETVKVLNE